MVYTELRIAPLRKARGLADGQLCLFNTWIAGQCRHIKTHIHSAGVAASVPVPRCSNLMQRGGIKRAIAPTVCSHVACASYQDLRVNGDRKYTVGCIDPITVRCYGKSELTVGKLSQLIGDIRGNRSFRIAHIRRRDREYNVPCFGVCEVYFLFLLMIVRNQVLTFQKKRISIDRSSCFDYNIFFHTSTDHRVFQFCAVASIGK